MNYTLYFDGSCWPTSPGGTAVSGYVLKKDDQIVESFSGVIGFGATSSLMAEYRAAVEGLRAFYTRWLQPGAESLIIHGDSKVTINQLSGKFTKAPKYLQEYWVAKHFLSEIEQAGVHVDLQWIPRAENIADQVCKRFRSSLP
jgi:ribonuclease HI